MKTINDKKVFTSVNDLKDLSHIPNSKKKQVMMKHVERLAYYLSTYKDAFAQMNEAKKKYYSFPAVTSTEKYKEKKLLCKQFAEAENRITTLKSKLSKHINSLLYDHNCASGKHNKMTVDELYRIVSAYENKQFQDNYFPARRLRVLKQNNLNWRMFDFQLHVVNQIMKGKFTFGASSKVAQKPKDYWVKQAEILEKKIEACKDRKGSLDETFRSMQYAKLIKRFDKLSHKTIKDYNPVTYSKYVIDFENITKYYYNKWMATKILKGFDLKIKQGEFVVILGPSGSGKTTLLNIMSGMDKATYGKTIVNSNNLIKMTDNQLTQFRKDNIGYIFQQYGLLPNLNVRENVEIGWNLQSDKSKRINIDELLKTVGMAEHAKKFPHELSGGQQQRVSVARSMAKNPAIVFGDEPTGAVDEEMSKQILQLFVDINKKFNTTVIIVTHNPIFADLASRVIKVNSGYIAQNYENKKRKTVEQLDWSSTH
ncbi:MAG: ABC transporter ATP-binding protein [Mycoplasmoidaceae bacterium]